MAHEPPKSPLARLLFPLLFVVHKGKRKQKPEEERTTRIKKGHNSESIVMSATTMSSQLWCSLFTLESTSQYAQLQPRPWRTCSPNAGDTRRLHKRHQKLSTAVALIGASSPGLKSVTACSTEILFDTNHAPSVTLRLAQNQGCPESDRQELQNLVDRLVEEVLRPSESVWSAKEDRKRNIDRIVIEVVLPFVVTRCEARLSAILGEHYSQPFRSWYTTIEKSLLETLSSRSQAILKFIYLSSANDQEKLDAQDFADVIVSASMVLGEAQLAAIFDSQGNQTGVPTSPSEGSSDEELDDYESLGPAESPAERFLRKLASYYTASYTVVRELVALRRPGYPLRVSVKTVPIVTTTSSPAEEGEYEDFDAFFKQSLGIEPKMLDPKKVDRLRDTWSASWRDADLFLHAEMQLALFYSLNPELCPIRGFIGVSQKCCYCCDFVLRQLQNTPLPCWELDRYAGDVAGPPLMFRVEGTHGRPFSRWVFPHPAKHINVHGLDKRTFAQVCHRFTLVREDLQKALLDQAKNRVSYLVKYSDSIDLEEDIPAISRETLDRIIQKMGLH